MKKICALCLSFIMLFCCIPLTAFAAETDSVGVSVCYQKWADREPNFTRREIGGFATRGSVHNLSDSKLSFIWTIAGEGSLESELVKTNTTKILVSFDLDKDASVKIELLDSSGNSLAETTLSYYLTDERTPTVKFTNLTSSKNYKVKITNNSQREITVFGGIMEKVFSW